jgi:hypothetical protein
MSFNLKNGLKITWYHLHDSQMIMGFFLAVILPALACFSRGFYIGGILYIILMAVLIIFIRCWDDPVKLGYEKEVKHGNPKKG